MIGVWNSDIPRIPFPGPAYVQHPGWQDGSLPVISNRVWWATDPRPKEKQQNGVAEMTEKETFHQDSSGSLDCEQIGYIVGICW